jgi:hypothetical protein
MDHLLSKEKGRRRRSLQARESRGKDLLKKAISKRKILQAVMFSFER